MVSDELLTLRNMFECIALWTKVIARSQLASNKNPKIVQEINFLLQELHIIEFEYIKSLNACSENQQIFAN